MKKDDVVVCTKKGKNVIVDKSYRIVEESKKHFVVQDGHGVQFQELKSKFKLATPKPMNHG